MSELDDKIGFGELLKTLRVINSKNKQCKLGECIDFELDDLMQAVNEYNKGGKIAIEITIGIEEKNELSLQATVKTTKPKGKIPKNPFFRDQKGGLYLDDPTQLKLIDARKVVEIERGAIND